MILNGNDLSGFDLGGIDLNTVNLFGANLSGADVDNTDFTGADLRNPDRAGAIADTQLRAAASLALANLRSNDLSGFDLSGINLSSINFSLANFSGADLTSADLGNTDLRNETVAEAVSDSQLRAAANVTGVNLGGNDLSGFDLSGLDLSSVNFSFADLVTSQFTSFPFGPAELSDANFHMAALPPSMPSLPVIFGVEVLVNSPLDVAGQTGVDTGGLLSIDGAAFSTAGLDVSGPVQVSDGVLTAGTLTGEEVITLDALSQLNAGDNADGTFEGFIVGSGSVAKHGTGQFTLGRNNGYSGGTSVVEGTLPAGSATGSGTVTIMAGGTFGGVGTVAGDVVIEDGGTLAPGKSAGVLTVVGLSMDQSAVLHTEIGGTDNSDSDNPQLDVLHVTGSASLAGTLSVSLIDDFLPSTPDPTFGGDGDTFLVMTANSIMGAFGSFNGLDYDNAEEAGRIFRVNQMPTFLTLTAFQAAYGDGNMDHVINSTDLFAILAAGKFNAGPSDATWIEGDLDNDGDVDSTDIFLIFGTGKYNQGPYVSASSAALVVPEPSSLPLVATGLFALLMYAWRRRRPVIGI